MKKLILAAALISLGLVAVPSWAVEAHHPAEGTTQSIEQITMEENGPAVDELEIMREQVEMEPDPVKRRGMMHQHMKMMREGMNMMSRMGGKHGAMAHGGPGGGMPMENRMSMMEQKMTMMEKMMGQMGKMMGSGMMGGGMMGGSMMCGDMMGGMMSGHDAGGEEADLKMMEKKMEMMQEIINGLLLQQELNMGQQN